MKGFSQILRTNTNTTINYVHGTHITYIFLVTNWIFIIS